VLVAREAVHEARTPPACECDDREAVPALGVADRRALGATFGLLFVAEMGDKTQLAVMSLAAKSPEPWLVFVGGGTALLVVTALGVLGGQGLCRVVPRHVLLRVSAAAFIGMGVLMLGGLL